MENRTPKPFLNFVDAGASDEEPAKGVTIGDIRAWHDQYDRLLSSWAECRSVLSEERNRTSRLQAALHEIEQTTGEDPSCCRGIAARALCDCEQPNPNEDPSGQRREPMSPHPLDDQPPFGATTSQLSSHEQGTENG